MREQVSHGHIFPRLPGPKARCGGPRFCLICAHELLSALCDIACDFGGHTPADHAAKLLATAGYVVEPVTESLIPQPSGESHA